MLKGYRHNEMGMVVNSEGKIVGRNKEYVVEGEIAPGATVTLPKELDGSEYFHCYEVIGTFTTLWDVGGDITDTGVDPFVLEVKETQKNYSYFDKPQTATQFLVPGRVPDMSAVNIADVLPANPIIRPVPFPQTFENKFEVRVTNISNIANKIKITFRGRRQVRA